jgi:hypothetical protein
MISMVPMTGRISTHWHKVDTNDCNIDGITRNQDSFFIYPIIIQELLGLLNKLTTLAFLVRDPETPHGKGFASSVGFINHKINAQFQEIFADWTKFLLLLRIVSNPRVWSSR